MTMEEGDAHIRGSRAPASIRAEAPLYPEVGPEGWPACREAVKARIAPYLGAPSDPGPAVPPAPRVVDEREHECGMARKVRYDVEPGESVSAWLLVPHGVSGPAPALLTLHETNPVAKDSMLWPLTKPNRDLGAFFARSGYVTFSPDHLAAGERAPDNDVRAFDTAAFYRRHPEWSAVGKMVRDARCALDVMTTFSCIDPNRIGVAGHSLGGYGSFIAAAYDERIRAAASSCGMIVWEDNPDGRIGFARDEWYIHFPRLRSVFLEEKPLPFELYEIAALVAPRPFLNMTAMQDRTYGINTHVPEAGRRLADLYARLDTPEGFANLLFGGGHDIPDFSRALMGAWFDRWLA